VTEQYICCLEVILPSLAAVVYGFAVIVRRYKGLYFTMGVMAVVSLMVGQLSTVVAAFAGMDIFGQFNIGTLGSVGSCLFFLTANVGPMGMLADDAACKRRKYRVLALAGPLAAAVLQGLCVLYMVKINYFTGLAAELILTAITMLPLYFNTKMAITPDVKDGFLTCMRPYNICVVVLMLLAAVERGLRNAWVADTVAEHILSYCLYAAIGLSTLGVVIFLKRGAKRWKNTWS